MLKVRLISVASGSAVVRIAVKDESFLIGRDKHADLTLNCTSSSRRHGLLIKDEHSVTILDLGSRNGTVVNGRRLKLGETVRLQHKDVLQFGSDAFRVSMRNSKTGEPFLLDEKPQSKTLAADDAEKIFGELDQLVSSNRAESALDALDDSLADDDVDFEAPKTIELDVRQAQFSLDALLDSGDRE